VHSASCRLSTVRGEATIVSGEDPGESVWKGLNVETLPNNGRVGELIVMDPGIEGLSII